MKAVVLGTGGWGTALSQILCDNGHETCLWSHNPAKAEEMARTRENPLLKGVHLPESLRITGDLECLRGANLVVSAPPSFAVRDTAKKMAPYLTDKSVVVSVSKGIERDTNLRLSQVIREETGDICKVAVLSGPSHAEEGRHPSAHRLCRCLPGSGGGPLRPGRLHERLLPCLHQRRHRGRGAGRGAEKRHRPQLRRVRRPWATRTTPRLC